ncbi:MAG TPA: hypothetical protein VGO57_14290 [Verrucomicrobiae bacterium]|jgi:hypothetical protein
MSFLTGTKASPAPDQKQLGLNDTSAATNEQGQPLPYLAGKFRFAGTFITDAFDQNSSTQGAGGKNSGKGGGGSGTNYYAGFGVAFCLGTVDGFHDLYLNGDAVFTRTTALRPNSLAQVNNIATFICTNAHGLTTGDQVVITGAVETEFNGEFTVTVLDAVTFTYVIPGSSIVAETASGQVQGWVKLDPIYRGDEDFIEITIPNYGILRIYWGTETQVADDYLAVSGTQHPPMHGVCYGVFTSFFIGLNQTNIQNIEAVLSRTPTAAWLANQADADIDDEANPAVVFYDLLTNPRCGLGLTDADFNLPGLKAAATQFKNEGLGISPLISRQDTAATLLQQLCETVDAVPILDANGLLLMLPIRNAADYSILPVINDDKLASIPKPKVDDWSNTHNDTQLVFPNRDAAFLNDFVEWKDFGASSVAQSLATPQTLQRDWITKRTIATALVQAAGPAGSIPERTGQADVVFTTDLWAALAPGNLFKLAYSLRPTGGGIFRVTKRTFSDPAQPKFTIEYAADRSYLNLTP